MQHKRYKWEIYLQENYDGSERTFLVVDRNEVLDSATPINSPGIEFFKAKKLSEIQYFEGQDVSHIPGIELLK